MTEADSGVEIAFSVEEQRDGASCGPAWIRTALMEAFSHQGKDPQAVPSQKEIARKVYTWRWGVFKHPLRFRDNWCLPTNVHRYLDTWFEDVNTNAGRDVTVDKIAEYIEEGRAVGVLIQDVIPDQSHPAGYQDSLDNGHWALVQAINLKEDWIELADSYRNKSGNKHWFDSQGVVLTDGNLATAERAKLTLEHRRIYRMRINDFVNNWWDYKFNPADGKFLHTIVAAKLDSLRELDKNNRPIQLDRKDELVLVC